MRRTAQPRCTARQPMVGRGAVGKGGWRTGGGKQPEQAPYPALLACPLATVLPTDAGHGEACAALLAGGASPDTVTPRKLTPLLMAAAEGHAAACAALMAGGANPNLKNPTGATPAQLVRRACWLLFARHQRCYGMHASVALPPQAGAGRLALAWMPRLFKPAACSRPGHPSPAAQAIAAGHAGAAAALVAGGLDPNHRLPDGPDGGLTLLEAAAHHGHGEVITALVNGALRAGWTRDGNVLGPAEALTRWQRWRTPCRRSHQPTNPCCCCCAHRWGGCGRHQCKGGERAAQAGAVVEGQPHAGEALPSACPFRATLAPVKSRAALHSLCCKAAT